MKTTLTLKYSTYFFHKHINLIKDVPLTVEVNDLDDSDIETLNTYIESGSILSTEGLLEKSVVLSMPTQVEKEQVEDETTEDESTNSEEEKEVGTASKVSTKRTTTRKTTTKK